MHNFFFRVLRNVKFKGVTGGTISIPFAQTFVDKSKLKQAELHDPKTLTHSFLIQQASGLAVNAATTLLTQTVSAVVDTSEQYKDSLLQLLAVLEDSKQNVGHNYPHEELSDLIIAARAQANSFKSELLELFSLLEYVEKVAESTAETSYLVGSEFLSTCMGERLHSAKMRVEEAKREINALEQELLKIQKVLIITEKSGKS